MGTRKCEQGHAKLSNTVRGGQIMARYMNISKGTFPNIVTAIKPRVRSLTGMKRNRACFVCSASYFRDPASFEHDCTCASTYTF